MTSLDGSSVLVVEDDDSVRVLLKLLLEDEGMTVAEAGNGQTALEAFARGSFEVVLLDLRLPGMSGFEVCRRMRAISEVPIIMVTAQHDSHDIVAGLECGADDYVTKPYSDRELVARIRAQLRRWPTGPGPATSLRFGRIELRPAEAVVSRDGVVVALTKTEFRLLMHLAESPNRVWTRDQLLEHVWDYAYDGDGRLVDTFVRRLRMKLEADPQRPDLIRTVRGIGYKLVG